MGDSPALIHMALLSSWTTRLSLDGCSRTLLLLLLWYTRGCRSSCTCTLLCLTRLLSLHTRCLSLGRTLHLWKIDSGRLAPAGDPEVRARDRGGSNPESIRYYTSRYWRITYTGAVAAPDRRAVLENATYPVLFIAGKDDHAVPPEKTHEESLLPDYCTVLWLAGVGHLGYLERPTDTRRAVRQLVEAAFSH